MHESRAQERGEAVRSAAEADVGHGSGRAARVADIVGGLAIGTQILLKGVDKLPHFSEHPFQITFLLLAGGFVLVGSLVHERLERRVRSAHGLFHMIEGAVLVVSAVMLFEKGKVRLPLVILFAGCLYALSGAVASLVTPENRERVTRRLRRGIGVVLLLAGVASLGLNLRGDRDPWFFVIGGLFLAMGLLLLLLPVRFAGER
jgi:hypothetical protein